MRGQKLAGGLCLIMALLTACASGSGSGGPGASHTPKGATGETSGMTTDDAPSRVATPHGLVTRPGAAPECGPVPTSSGPLAHLARLSLEGPSSASAGASAQITTTVSSMDAAPRVIATPATSGLLVVRGNRVVGGVLGGSAPEVPLQLSPGTASPAQTVPSSVRLVACNGGGAGAEAALEAGRYSLVAVLGYRVDSLNSAPNDGPSLSSTGGRGFVLVSAPAAINIS